MEDILVERRGAAAWITLNRASAGNSLSLAVNQRLVQVVRDLGGDSDVRAVVITGAGGKIFCAGADLKERKGVPASEAGPYVDAIGAAINAVAGMTKPTVAVINGAAIGGGFELALACDFRIAADHAVFQLKEVQLGILPGAGGTQRLPRLVGLAAAKELVLLGRRIDATRAHALGVVTQVVPGDQLAASANAIVDELEYCAPISLAKAKEAMERGFDVDFAKGLAIERACYDVTLVTEDRDEGLLAFAEKRKPVYRGR